MPIPAATRVLTRSRHVTTTHLPASHLPTGLFHSNEKLRPLPIHRAYAAEQKVALLSAPKKFSVQQRSVPTCGPTDVVVKVEGCGLGAASLPLWAGRPWTNYPLAEGAPGQEGWGEISALGDQMRYMRPDLRVGQRVTFLSDQALAQYVKVTACDVVSLPHSLDGISFPGHAIGCAMNIFNRSRIHAGQTVTIVGAGFLGLLLVQLAVSAGARVIVISRRKSALALAERFGAEATITTDDRRYARKVAALTGGRGCDRVIEVNGQQFALDLATEIIAQYGTLVIAGQHQDGERQVDLREWNERGIDVVNAHEHDSRGHVRGIIDAITATEEGRIRPQELLTHRFGLDQLDEAFQMMVDLPDDFVKGWVQL